MLSESVVNPSLLQAISDTLGDVALAARRLAGGDINEAYTVKLASGRDVFVKTHRRADPRMFPAEARGLRWLGQAAAEPEDLSPSACESLRLPEVLAVSADDSEGPHFLVLEMLQSAAPTPDFEERFGRGLAALHRRGAPCFGLDHDNFIATLPQDNRPTDGWAEFYWQRRLAPQLRLAVDGGHIDRGLAAKLERLEDRLHALVADAEVPARLHGDLWAGNKHVDVDGGPCIIDPAVYGGHREVDLAMMRLFGGFSERCFAAYHEVFPLQPDVDSRVALYQLYPLLVHVNLFGGSYVQRVAAAVARYV